MHYPRLKNIRFLSGKKPIFEKKSDFINSEFIQKKLFTLNAFVILCENSLEIHLMGKYMKSILNGNNKKNLIRQELKIIAFVTIIYWGSCQK